MATNRKWTIEEMKPGHEPQREKMVVIHWNHHEDAPRVRPPVVLAHLGSVLTFRVEGNARAVVNLPEAVRAEPTPIEIGPKGEAKVHLVADREALLPEGFMYAYTIEMTHLGTGVDPNLRAMEAVGCSPPGMVLDDPTGGR